MREGAPVGPARIPHPQVATAQPAEMAPARTLVRLVVARIPNHRLIDADVLSALDRERLVRTPEIDREAAATPGFSADRAVAEIERVGVLRLQAEPNCAAMTRAFQVHD